MNTSYYKHIIVLECYQEIDIGPCRVSYKSVVCLVSSNKIFQQTPKQSMCLSGSVSACLPSLNPGKHNTFEQEISDPTPPPQVLTEEPCSGKRLLSSFQDCVISPNPKFCAAGAASLPLEKLVPCLQHLLPTVCQG